MTPETPREAGRRETALLDALTVELEFQFGGLVDGSTAEYRKTALTILRSHDVAAAIAAFDRAAPATGLPAAEGLREAIEQELALLPPEKDMTQFESGAAAAYNYVLSRWPAADRAERGLPLDAALTMLAGARRWVQRCANCGHDNDRHDLRLNRGWCAGPDDETMCFCSGWGGDGPLLRRIDAALAADPQSPTGEET